MANIEEGIDNEEEHKGRYVAAAEVMRIIQRGARWCTMVTRTSLQEYVETDLMSSPSQGFIQDREEYSSCQRSNTQRGDDNGQLLFDICGIAMTWTGRVAEDPIYQDEDSRLEGGYCDSRADDEDRLHLICPNVTYIRFLLSRLHYC